MAPIHAWVDAQRETPDLQLANDADRQKAGCSNE
jgi:hypothetical protein